MTSSSLDFQSLLERVKGGKTQKPEHHFKKNEPLSLSTNKILRAQQASSLYNENTTSDSLHQEEKKDNEGLGKGWFHLKPVEVTEGLKRDLQVIQMRNYLDPKRFYKNSDKPGVVLGVGTVISGPFDLTSSRLTKKERKESIVQEILNDKSIKKYSKRVFSEIQKTKQSKLKFNRGRSNKKREKLRKLF